MPRAGMRSGHFGGGHSSTRMSGGHRIGGSRPRAGMGGSSLKSTSSSGLLSGSSHHSRKHSMSSALSTLGHVAHIAGHVASDITHHHHHHKHYGHIPHNRHKRLNRRPPCGYTFYPHDVDRYTLERLLGIFYDIKEHRRLSSSDRELEWACFHNYVYSYHVDDFIRWCEDELRYI